MTNKLYSILASTIDAYYRCIECNNTEWRDRHEAYICKLVNRYMPSGSGVDSGTKFSFDASNGEKLVFTAGYHHMNDGGYYDGWTEHTITVKPSMIHGIELSISGRNRNDIKDYLYELFQHALTIELDDETQKAIAA